MALLTTNIKSRVKHLDRKKYWIREFISNKNTIIRYVDTKYNLADLFTKYVPNTVLEYLRPALMGREDPPRSTNQRKQVSNVNVIRKRKNRKKRKRLILRNMN